MKRAFAMAVALLMTAPAVAAGQEPLTLDQAVQAVLTGNAHLRAMRAGRAEADAKTVEAMSGRYPRLSVTESWQRGDEPVFVFGSLLAARRFAAANLALDTLNHPDAIGFFHTTVGVEQVLFDGGRQRALAAAAAQGGNIVRATADETADALILQATQTFGRIITAQAAYRAAEAGLAAAREDRARAEHRRDAGMATDAELLALNVHMADLERRAIQAHGDEGIAQAELNRLMGRPVDRAFQPIEPSDAIEETTRPAALQALLAEADAARPEIARAIAVTGAADAARRQARASLWPQIVGRAAVDVSGTRLTDRASAWILGGELRWTFSTGGAERARQRAAAQAAIGAQAEVEEARAGVHVDIVTALRRLETARAQQKAGRAAVEQARESQRIVRNRFDAGVSGVNDVLRASTDMLEAEANRVSALVDSIVGRAMLARALGRTP
jgi:outer membrane protein TolC